jgi:hypothetical protein
MLGVKKAALAIVCLEILFIFEQNRSRKIPLKVEKTA